MTEADIETKVEKSSEGSEMDCMTELWVTRCSGLDSSMVASLVKKIGAGVPVDFLLQDTDCTVKHGQKIGYCRRRYSFQPLSDCHGIRSQWPCYRSMRTWWDVAVDAANSLLAPDNRYTERDAHCTDHSKGLVAPDSGPGVGLGAGLGMPAGSGLDAGHWDSPTWSRCLPATYCLLKLSSANLQQAEK